MKHTTIQEIRPGQYFCIPPYADHYFKATSYYSPQKGCVYVYPYRREDHFEWGHRNLYVDPDKKILVFDTNTPHSDIANYIEERYLPNTHYNKTMYGS